MPNANYGSSFCGYAEIPCTVPRTVETKPPNSTPITESSTTPPDNTPQPNTTPVTG